MTAPARNLSLATEPLSESLANVAQAIYALTGEIPSTEHGETQNRIHVQAIKLAALAELEGKLDYLAGMVKAGDEERIQLCDQLRELRESWDDLDSLGVHISSKTTAIGATHRVSHRYERLVLETDDYHKALTLTEELYALQQALSSNTNHKQVSND